MTSRPSDEILIRAQRRNSDGIGLAWVDNGLVRWEKHITVEHLLERLHTNQPKFPFVMHFRVATQGGSKPELCHPFACTPKASTALSGVAKSVLFHNGNWTGWAQEVKQALLWQGGKVPGGPWSDSRAMACLAGVYGPHIFDLLDMNSQRIVILNGDGTVQKWGAWSPYEGWFASNPTFTDRATSGMNIEGDKDWQRNPERYDPKTRALVRVARNPEPELQNRHTIPGLGVTCIEGGRVVPASTVPMARIIRPISPGGSLNKELTLGVVADKVLQLRVFCKREGYLSILEV